MFLQPGKIILKLIWSSKAARKAKTTSKTNRKTERLSTIVLTLTQLSVTPWYRQKDTQGKLQPNRAQNRHDASQTNFS